MRSRVIKSHGRARDLANFKEKKVTIPKHAPSMSENFPGVASLQRIAGNDVVRRLVEDCPEGRPLDPATRVSMERGFGTGLKGVHIHSDAGAQAAARSVNAAAFTYGENIYVGPDAPSLKSPTGRELLAHEVAHVVQQRRSSTTVGYQVSQSSDRFEHAADIAAQQVLQGGRAGILAPGGTPPEIQRKPRDRGSRDEAQQAFEELLHRVQAAQGGKTLRVTSQIRYVAELLSSNDPIRGSAVQAWLQSGTLPEDPKAFAAELAARLPDKIDPAIIDRIRKMRAKPESASTSGRIARLVEKSTPSEPSHSEAPGEPSSQERFEREIRDIRRAQGQPPESKVGPVAVDVGQLGRIAKGLPEALHGPPSHHPAPVLDPKIQKRIQQLVTPDALVPSGELQAQRRAEEKFEEAAPWEERKRRTELKAAREATRKYADPDQVAADLAGKFLTARQYQQTEVDLELGNAYKDVRNPKAIFSEVKKIATIVRNGLGSQAESVVRVNVLIGGNIATVIRLDSPPK